VKAAILPPNLDAETERTLVAAARANPDAFRALYRQYFPRVYAYIAYRVGRALDAEDLTADVFVKVVEALPRFEDRGAGSFPAWLFRIAHNAVSQFYRGRPALEPISLDETPDIQAEPPSLDSLLARKEQFLRLRERVAALSPRRAEIIRLKYFGGLRNQEIAAVLGLDERTVAAHLSRALADLGREYAQEETRYESE
jgi:RNA polymerase sigma-70 factor (ECF subfamily)